MIRSRVRRNDQPEPTTEPDLDAADARHKHEQVRGHLLDVMEQRLSPRDKLPTERELAEELGVSRSTVRRALDQMAAEGRVYRVQGAGTFVAEWPIRKREALTSFSEDMRARGLTPSARLLNAEETIAGAERSWPLRVSPAEPLLHVERLRLADDVPMCLESVYVVKRFAPDLLERGGLAGSLYDVLAEGYRIDVQRAEQSIAATVLEPDDAELLEVPALWPALLVERVAIDQQGRRVELARSLYRGDRYRFDLTLERRP
jgi:GntR family transcriptional regulator